MSILIRGMEMPTNCAHCMIWSICPALPYGEWPDYESILTNDVIGDGGIRHPDCPLVHVPPHGRLIDADVLKDLYHFNTHDSDIDKAWTCNIRRSIDNAPTVIKAEEG